MASEPKALHELTIDEVRERLGREPSPAEWIMLTKAAAASRDWTAAVEQLAHQLGV